ncbi:aspartyl protease [Dolichospermum circinale]|uniref:aspartyl protease n=1 Tax=Dolichospermum circinale TaxID=109265 RepID=UPI002330664E|nr:aspartyl protease [Dolichospermum circinale]MDB9454474.1 aspartyl protease [Dolichospermum circinale CS-541/06]MDB9464482.1 aspartyl protease [Dolichospermum circinale CS-541/04]MDB9546940.1 aspartyl protease [Dolichospermum circinale CS-1031]
MIQGNFGSEGQLFFELDLITADGLNLPVDAMLDTGFTKFMAINTQDLDGLDWVFLGNEPMQTAQGESRFNIYLGKVILDGKEYEIPVHVGDNITEVLLGSEWLKFLRLVVDFPEDILTFKVTKSSN